MEARCQLILRSPNNVERLDFGPGSSCSYTSSANMEIHIIKKKSIQCQESTIFVSIFHKTGTGAQTSRDRRHEIPT